MMKYADSKYKIYEALQTISIQNITTIQHYYPQHKSKYMVMFSKVFSCELMNT